MSEPVIAVVGFPRSGTSLMMRMLHVGGIEVVAENHASYEDPRSTVISRELDWLRECGGKAVKLLEPQRLTLPDIPYRFIWCRRNPAEQARSQIKILTEWMGLPFHAGDVPRIAQGIIRDTPVVMEKLELFKASRLIAIDFEKLLAEPLACAVQIEHFLERPRPLDLRAMISEVRARTPKCFDGFLEMEWADR